MKNVGSNSKVDITERKSLPERTCNTSRNVMFTTFLLKVANGCSLAPFLLYDMQGIFLISWISWHPLTYAIGIKFALWASAILGASDETLLWIVGNITSYDGMY
jgi:hypothetical protein